MFSSFISGVYGIVLLSNSERITEYLDFSKTGFSRLAIAAKPKFPTMMKELELGVT